MLGNKHMCRSSSSSSSGHDNDGEAEEEQQKVIKYSALMNAIQICRMMSIW
jgi:hypothetical protein